MLDPPQWSKEQLQRERLTAIDLFRAERLQEPLDDYCTSFDRYMGIFEEVFEWTVDLSDLSETAIADVLTRSDYLEAFRYLAGPAISEDDLQTVANVDSLAASRLRKDPQAITRIAEVVISCLDRRRFPWVTDEREPSEMEKHAAIIASAALVAQQRAQTLRRNEGKARQENKTREALLSAGFHETHRRTVAVIGDAPGDGEFCGETKMGTRKADFVVGFWDHRKIPIECKVSNSELNSVKRLNNDAAAKAESWISDFGPKNVIPIAVLSGVFKLSTLEEAQHRGLTLIWAHDLGFFVQWLRAAKES